MKMTALKRGLLGFPLGIALGYGITIAISLFVADGAYSPCVPALADAFASEIHAVVFQAILCGLLGASCAAASVIWELEDWSIVKQTGIYFLVLTVTMFPIAWFTHWMDHSLVGFLLYTGVSLAIFVFVWIIQYLVWKGNIKAINHKIDAGK